MKVNKLMNALLVFLILITCIGAVSASADASIDDTIASVDSEPLAVDQGSSSNGIDDIQYSNSNDVQSVSAPESSLDDEVQAVSNEEKNMGSESSDNTLKEDDTLSYREIQDALVDGYEYNLTKNVKFNPDTDSARGILIAKKMTINGNGFTIDGDNLAKMFLVDGGPFILNNVTLINGLYNGSGGGYSGGAMYIGTLSATKQINVILNNVTFINNHARIDGASVDKGGAIYMNANRGSLTLNNCTFENNSASGYGGAIAVIKGELNISNSKFENNYLEYEGHGGAIYTENGPLTVDHSKFYNNKAGNDTNGFGGAIAANNLKLSNSEFINNTAYKGGAIGNPDRVSTKYNITNTTFENNKAKLTGGAILVPHYNSVPPTVVVNIEDSSFKDNDGGRYGGGAICTPNATVKNSNFTNNTVFLYGGAISTTNLTADNCIFENNSAKRAGAIFALNLTLKQSKFDGNEAADDSIIVTHKDFVHDDATALPNVVTYPKIYDAWEYTYDATGDYNYFLHCIEHELYDWQMDSFCTTDPGYLINYRDNSEVIEQLRILYYLCHIDENFLDGGFRNYWGQYNISGTVYDLCSEDLSNPQSDDIKRIMDLYNSGFRVPDKQFFLPNGTLVKYTIYFFINGEDVQNYIWYHYTTEDVNETVSKETLNKTVKVGENVEFRITVTNNGNSNLTKVFVNDSDFDEGLIYQSYMNETGNWDFNDTSKIWTLTTDLEPGKSASFIVIFKTTKVGELVNNVTAGFMDFTMANSTNTTNVTNVTENNNETNDTNETNETDVPEDEDIIEDDDTPEEEDDVPDDETPEEEDDVPDEKVVVPDKKVNKNVSKAHISKTATGNPLFALVLMILTLVFVPRRRH